MRCAFAPRQRRCIRAVRNQSLTIVLMSCGGVDAFCLCAAQIRAWRQVLQHSPVPKNALIGETMAMFPKKADETVILSTQNCTCFQGIPGPSDPRRGPTIPNQRGNRPGLGKLPQVRTGIDQRGRDTTIGVKCCLTAFRLRMSQAQHAIASVRTDCEVLGNAQEHVQYRMLRALPERLLQIVC